MTHSDLEIAAEATQGANQGLKLKLGTLFV